MKKIRIVTRSGEFSAVLDDSDISNAIWLSLPQRPTINMMGGEIYFEMPLDPHIAGLERVTELKKGDIAWWPGPRAIRIFYGSTPLSVDDGDPVSSHPVIRIGHIDDCEGMEDSGDRQRILIERES